MLPGMFDSLARDIRYGLRLLWKSPGFTTAAVLSLGLGIGANAAIFTLFDQVLLRQLPVSQPERLVLLDAKVLDEGSLRSRDEASLYFSYPMYRDLRDRNTVFSGMLATCTVPVAIEWQDQTERSTTELVSGNYFDVIGVRPALGRLFTQSDDLVPNANPVAVLSYGYWQRHFGRNPAVLNLTIHVNGYPFTIVGVAHAAFRSITVGDAPDIFAPMMMKAQVTPSWNDLDGRRSRWLNIVARLKPGITRRQAEAGMNPLWRALRERELQDIPDASARFRAEFIASHMTLLEGAKGFSSLRRQLATPLAALMAMVGLVLLIACANVANLLLARAASRQKEVAVRFALGAGRARLVRQFVLESLTLAIAGGAVGVLLSSWTVRFLLRLLPPETSFQVAFSSDPDTRVLAFTVAVSAFTGILFGLAPAIQATGTDVAPALKEQAAGVLGGGSRARLRQVLVALQVGLSLLLVVGAGLFGRSLYNLKNLDLGFRTDHLLAFTLNPPRNTYNAARMLAFHENVQSSISAQAGVRAVTASRIALLVNDVAGSNITVAGYEAKEGEDMSPNLNRIAPGFFSTMGMTLIAGRDFTGQDAAGAPKVAIVNEKFASYFFGTPGASVGRNFGFGAGSGVKTDIQIVGVVRDARYARVHEETPRFIYLPHLQDPDPGGMTFYVRTSQDPALAAPAVRRTIQGLDRGIPIENLHTMEDQIDDNLWMERIVTTLAISFGILATALAAIGLYGVVSYSVSHRTREIGIRMALGASNGAVLRLVMTEVALLAGIGIAIAAPVAMYATRLLQSQLYGLAGNDPATLFAAGLLLAIVAGVAGYIPARRASRVDPMVALRHE
jgi:putative ABC transport system permease protein